MQAGLRSRMREVAMKYECQSCHEINAIPDPELPVRTVEKIVKEKCQCGMTADYRLGRVVVFAVACVLIAAISWGVMADYVELQKIKYIDPSKLEVKEDPAGLKGLIVVPKKDGEKK